MDDHPAIKAVLPSDISGISKPNPVGYKLILEKLDRPVEETAFIGDNPKTDILGANLLGITTIRIRRWDSKRRKVGYETKFAQDRADPYLVLYKF